MKCPGQLRIDRDLNVEFTTGFIFRDHAASVGGMGLEHLTTDALCFLAEWKHVLIFGHRISTATYRLRTLPVMDFEKRMEDPCQDLPRTAWKCLKHVEEKTKDLDKKQLINLCHSTAVAIFCDHDNLDMRRAAERHRESDIYEPNKQEQLA